MIRRILPHFTERTFRVANQILNLTRNRCREQLNFEVRWISRPDGSRLRLCIYSPLIPKSQVPGLLWIHGGGYAMGIPEMDHLRIRRFIAASGCVVVAPDYRLSSQSPYPAALEDCYAALLWLKTHGGEYGMREDQIMVGGNSAGGGLTAALSLYARDRGEVAIAYHMPLYPMLDDRMETASSRENDAPVWNSESNRIAWRLYLGDQAGGPDVPAYAAPARAADLTGLPPTCTFVGSIDPFRDETLAYVEKLTADGIPVNFREFPGCFHAFEIICPRSTVAREAWTFLLESFSYAVDHYFSSQPSSGKTPRSVGESVPFPPVTF